MPTTDWFEMLLIIAPFIGFVFIWIGVLHLVARLSGWKKLYEQLGSHSSPQVIGNTSKKFRFVSGRFNKTQYKNSLTVKTSRYALMLELFPLFSIGHKPLVIPWQKIESLTPHKFFFQRYVTITLRSPLSTVIELPESLFLNNSHLPANLSLSSSTKKHENPYQQS